MGDDWKKKFSVVDKITRGGGGGSFGVTQETNWNVHRNFQNESLIPVIQNSVHLADPFEKLKWLCWLHLCKYIIWTCITEALSKCSSSNLIY